MPTRVELGRLLLEAPDEQHLAQQREGVRAIERGRRRRHDHRSASVAPSSVEMSPSGRPSSRALSSRRMIFPLRVLGRFGSNAISLGATTAPSRVRAKASSSRRSASLGSNPVLERDEGLDHLHGHRVGLADHAGLGHGRVLHQDALHLEGADQVAGRLDHVIGAADEPEVAVAIPPREIAREIEAADEALPVARRLLPVAAEHGGPARAKGQLALHVGLLDDLHAIVADAPHDGRLARRAAAAPWTRGGCPWTRSWRS